MGFTIKQNTKYAVVKETTEGVYEAPTSGADFITVLEDGAEMNGTKEALERSILGTGLTKATSRTANREVSGSIPTEFKAGSTEGSNPEYGILVEATLGSKRNETTTVTTATGHTASQIEIEDADIAKFSVGDTVLIKEAGAYHTSPITAVDSTIGAANITLLVAADAAPSDNVDIAPFYTYLTADSGHPTYSISKYIEDAVETQGIGCRTASMSLDNFAANQLASWNFGFQGVDFLTSLNAPGFTPVLDSSLPPIIVEACIYKDGVKIAVSEMSFSVENTIATITSTCAKSGKIGSRIAERSVTGTMTPYISDTDIDIQTEFDNDSVYSIYGRAYNPTAVAGEFNQIVAFYMPNVNTVELTETDLDGVLQHSISFEASGGPDGSETQLFISFI